MVTITKLDVARELLDEALHLYTEEKAYFASLHLAGAAEEILGQYVEEQGQVSSFVKNKNAAIQISNILRQDGTRANDTKMGNLINAAKNTTKHKQGKKDHMVKFDARSEAYDILDRALDNYYTLMDYFDLTETEAMRKFNKNRIKVG